MNALNLAINEMIFPSEINDLHDISILGALTELWF